MSRVGKLPIDIPSNVEVNLSSDVITVKGPLGTLSQACHELVKISVEAGKIVFDTVNQTRESNAMSGTLRALVNNLVQGVTKGFQKKLVLVGVGYKAQLQDGSLNLALGFSHPVIVKLPAGIKITIISPTEFLVGGFCKQAVGQLAAVIRSFRPPEPYKGKGVRYADEKVVLKETKKK